MLASSAKPYAFNTTTVRVDAKVCLDAVESSPCLVYENILMVAAVEVNGFRIYHLGLRLGLGLPVA